MKSSLSVTDEARAMHVFADVSSVQEIFFGLTTVGCEE